ncbi:unnamed protein product [Didymodactylos carnosus]|nr:unnamed protein product [Didymodactylos carnosus]CAF3683006.1 unnamed protein product [Didymodactylos carnosus]
MTTSNLSLLKFPQIHPVKSDNKVQTKTGTTSFEQWRASIHKQLEEDLQRKVREVLEESERQERLAKLKYRR